jgi:hypothetical protein
MNLDTLSRQQLWQLWTDALRERFGTDPGPIPNNVTAEVIRKRLVEYFGYDNRQPTAVKVAKPADLDF